MNKMLAMRADIDNAIKCAKEYDSDYPYTLKTASEAVWALGQGYKGILMANEVLHKTIKELLEVSKRFVENSPCTNGCDENDMTCDTQFAKRVIAKAEEIK